MGWKANRPDFLMYFHSSLKSLSRCYLLQLPLLCQCLCPEAQYSCQLSPHPVPIRSLNAALCVTRVHSDMPTLAGLPGHLTVSLQQAQASRVSRQGKGVNVL